MIERGRNGALRRIKGPPTLADITYIDDAVQAHLRAADRLLAGGDEARRISGRPYFVSSGNPVEIWDFLNGLLEAAGLSPVRKSVSPRTALMAAWVLEKVHALSGAEGDPRLSRWMVRQLTTARWFDISAARRDLGYDPQVSLKDGMRRLKTWFDEKDHFLAAIGYAAFLQPRNVVFHCVYPEGDVMHPARSAALVIVFTDRDVNGGNLTDIKPDPRYFERRPLTLFEADDVGVKLHRCIQVRRIQVEMFKR